MLKKPYRILVIDDVESVVEILAEQIKDLFGDELEIFLHSDPKSFAEIVRKHSVDIILTDINMPEMTGDMVLRKAQDEKKNIQTIVMTGDLTFSNIVNAYRDGATALIRKPFVEEEIKQAIQICIIKLDHWRNHMEMFRKT